jgi:hypothetical protein
MSRLPYLSGFGAFVFFFGVTALAAPVNDNFAYAIPLTGLTVTTTGSNSDATRESGEPRILGISGGHSVWWRWTAPDNGLTTIDTFGSSFDTLLGVYTGNILNSLTPIASDDDYFNSSSGFFTAQSLVQFGAVAGTTYDIAVDGFGGSSGSITLHITGPNGVLITSPTNGQVVTYGDRIPFTVTLSTNFPSPPASRVDLYRGGLWVGSVSNAPFTISTTNTPLGTNRFFAVAIGTNSQSYTSAPTQVFVQNVGVTLLTPFDDSVFFSINPITSTAWAYLPPGLGTITNIEFYVDGVKFGQDSTAPYGAIWNTITSGSHRLTAVGTSDSGATYNSNPLYIGVYQTFLPVGSIWKYLDNGSDQGTNWSSPNFDDSSWGAGPSPLGYNNPVGRPIATTNSYGSDANNKFTTTYYRQAFVITNLASYSTLEPLIQRDDGIVVYLNGVEIFRNNMPSGTITYTTLASSSASDNGQSTYGVIPDRSLFVEGTNVMAAEVHQNAANSPDLWFELYLWGIPLIVRNQSPLVAITNPVANAYFLAPDSLTIEASASDSDGGVRNVEFFVDGLKIGETASAPYSVVWTNPPIGAHTLTARATDDQGAAATSAAVPVVVYDAIGTPVVQITAPLDGAVMEGPTNLLVQALANAISGVTNVQFFTNGVEFGNVAAAPYAVSWPSSFLSNSFYAVVYDGNGVTGTSAPVSVFITIPPTNTVAPFIAAQFPPGGSTLTNLTSLQVIFSERVQNVDASDLLINGIPATGLAGGGSNYVFSFPQPGYGEVEIAWASGHGITDFGWPTVLPFDELGATAQWEYMLIDRTPPAILARTPAGGSTVTNLTQISVTFTEPVSGVDATDLLVNGVPATGLNGSGSSYLFSVLQPPDGTVNVTWAAGNGIFDLADVPNAFNGAASGWNFTLDLRTLLVQSNSNWRFLKGTAEASAPIDAWRQPGFDASGWSNAPAPFYYGDPYSNPSAGITGTLLSDMQGGYSSVYFIKEFQVANLGAITNLFLNAQCDDGFIAWINGVEVLRYNVSGGELPYNGVSSSASPEPQNVGAAYILYSLPSAVSALVTGTNVLAVHAFNQSLSGSSDFGFNAQLYTYLADASAVPPRVAQVAPLQGDVLYLTNLIVTFSEGVTNVDAADLLVNDVPATDMTSDTNTTYNFSFAQPPYGPVVITWAAEHGIVDFDMPPKAFNENAPSATLHYTLLNPSSPRILSQIPAAGMTVTGLTSITMTFTESVTNVDAADLLVNGTPASTVMSDDGITYTFSFVQPAFGTVTIRWAVDHGITDIEMPPNDFDPTHFGGQWNYTLIDPRPRATVTSPANNAYVLAPATVTLRATASDNDGTIAQVDFLANGVDVGATTNSPYSFTWTNVSEGTYFLRAVATDNSGLMGTSAPVVLNVVTSLPVFLVRGPYLQMGSPTGAVVRWRSDSLSDSVVLYGLDAAALTNLSFQTAQTTEHIVTLSGLSPDTRYFYSIGSSSQRLAGTNGPGSAYWFKTSPVAGTIKPTRFWVLGDSGTGNANAASVRDAYYTFAGDNGPADFWLMLGDNAYNSGQDTEYQSAVFDMYPDTLRNLFLWPTIGNHESDQSTTANDFPYLNIFSLPHNGEAGGVPSGTQKYYSFDYANIHFLCLDSMTSGRTTNTAMAQWLLADLAATSQQWVIAFFHHPPYTHGSHNSDAESDLIAMRQNIIPLLEQNGVDLVLNGHSHVHERSYLLYGHYGLSSTLTPDMKIDGGDGRMDGTGPYHKNSLGQGVVYSVSGSSGQYGSGALDHPAHYISLNELGSVIVDVNGKRLDLQFLNNNGVVSDHFTLVKEPTPAAPLGLVANVVDANTVNLTWTDPSTNAFGYVLERSTNGLEFIRFATNAVNVTNILDEELIANATYYYRVRSFGLGGESSPVSASITTEVDTAVPQAPDRLVVNSRNGPQSAPRIALHWRDHSDNEAGFLIERSSDGTTFSALATVGANMTFYVDGNVDAAASYSYRVRSFNSAGASAPSNQDDGQSHPQDNVVLLGGSATFHAGADGTPPFAYQWRFNDTDIIDATNEFLIITNAQISEEGPYTVRVTDAGGPNMRGPAWLFVLAPPLFSEQPASRTNLLGSTATFHVIAAGTAPLNYQWRKDNVDLAGATTAQITIGSASLADQGNYAVVVFNNLGAVTSQVARLVVNTPPVAGPDNLTAFDYQTITISSAALLANDSDADGDALTITSVSPASSRGGTVSLSGGSIYYSPPTGFVGSDTFDYQLADSRGASVGGQVTVDVSGNRPPVLALNPNYVISVLSRLMITNLASDPDSPTNNLTLLGSGVPGNAHLESDRNRFYWTPIRSQAPSTNVITIRVADDGVPPLTNTATFTIYVNDYIEVTGGTSNVVTSGDSGIVPIDIFSSAPLASLQCQILFPGERLTNLTIEALAPVAITPLLDIPSNNVAVLTLTPLASILQGTQHLALHFTAVTNQSSAFVPVRFSSIIGTRPGPGLAPTVLVHDGRVVVIGDAPLVEALPPSGGLRPFMLYGRKSTTYTIEYCTNTLGNTWLVRGNLSMASSLAVRASFPNTYPPTLFMRAKK